MRRTLMVLAVPVAALILGACGGDDDQEAENQATRGGDQNAQQQQATRDDDQKPQQQATRADDEAEKQATRPVSGHFIGKTADDRAAVAVLAEEEGTTRKVSVYVSDGNRTAEWFTSKTTANAVTLTSEDKDAKVRLELAKGLASGAVELSGQSLAFRAPPRTAGEGLYLATITERGYSARSPSGIRLTGRHTGATSRSTARFPDGRSTPFTVQWSGHVRSGARTLDRPPPGRYRWITTEGRFFGAEAQPATTVFIDPPHA